MKPPFNPIGQFNHSFGSVFDMQSVNCLAIRRKNIQFSLYYFHLNQTDNRWFNMIIHVHWLSMPDQAIWHAINVKTVSVRPCEDNRQLRGLWTLILTRIHIYLTIYLYVNVRYKYLKLLYRLKNSFKYSNCTVYDNEIHQK